MTVGRCQKEWQQILAKLLTDAAEGKPEDKKLADCVNSWIPSNFREPGRAAPE
jgi:hypothetical protein